jgi:hypothetical protein
MTMTLVIAFVLLTIVVDYFVYRQRMVRIESLAASEKLRMRFSTLRHRLVVYAGSGEMQARERQAFGFLYRGLTLFLRYPRMYPLVSAEVCTSAFRGRESVISPPNVQGEDFSPETIELLREFIRAVDDLVENFASPIFTAYAKASGAPLREVLHMARQRKKQAEKDTLRQWSEQGRNVLRSWSAT